MAQRVLNSSQVNDDYIISYAGREKFNLSIVRKTIYDSLDTEIASIVAAQIKEEIEKEVMKQLYDKLGIDLNLKPKDDFIWSSVI